MKRNMGSSDRIIRAIVGVVLVVLGIVNLGFWWGILMLIIGICPLYGPCKCTTLKK